MNTGPNQLTALIERLDALLLASGIPLTDDIAQPASIWIVDACPTNSFAGLLRRSLAFLGILDTREITVEMLQSTNVKDQKGFAPFVISFSSMGESVDQNRSIEEWCGNNSMPWTRAVIDVSSGYADAGPIFLSGYTPCYRCFARLHLNHPSKAITNVPHCSTVAFWSNMLAPSLVALHGQSVGPYIQGGLKRFNMLTLQCSHLRQAFFPSCPCRQFIPGAKRPLAPEKSTPETYDQTASIFEDWVGRERPYRASQSSAMSFVSRSLVTKSYPNSISTGLAKPSPLGSATVAELLETKGYHRSDPLTVEDLTALLFYSVGLRFVDISRANASRWTASAGNLGSSELFIFANEIHGIVPGLYNYRAIAHDLVNLDFRRAPFWRDCFSPPGQGEALFCFSGAYHRLEQKYGAFGYRLANMDAGVAYSQASLIARSLGTYLTLVKRVDELEMTRNLNLSQMREHLTCVALLSIAKPDRNLELRPPRHASQLPADPSSRGDISRTHFPSGPLAEVLYLKSMGVALGRASRGAPTVEKHHGTINPQKTSTLERADSLKLMDVLWKRKSVRRFDRKGLPHAALVEAFRAAYQADYEEWPEEHAEGRSLHLFLLENTNGAHTALYEYAHREGTLGLIRTIPCLSSLPTLFVDPCFHNVPSAIWIVGNLAEATRSHGPYGHRQLLFRSGAAANRLWLTAISQNIVGTISAGLLPRIARQLLGFDGWNRLALCAFLAGFSVDGVLPENEGIRSAQ